jgi:hypothetical protein
MIDQHFYFVQLPWGPWTIAQYYPKWDGWKLTDGNDNWTDTDYFKAIGDRIPVPPDGNHLSIQW